METVANQTLCLQQSSYATIMSVAGYGCPSTAKIPPSSATCTGAERQWDLQTSGYDKGPSECALQADGQRSLHSIQSWRLPAMTFLSSASLPW